MSNVSTLGNPHLPMGVKRWSLPVITGRQNKTDSAKVEALLVVEGKAQTVVYFLRPRLLLHDKYPPRLSQPTYIPKNLDNSHFSFVIAFAHPNANLYYPPRYCLTISPYDLRIYPPSSSFHAFLFRNTSPIEGACGVTVLQLSGRKSLRVITYNSNMYPQLPMYIHYEHITRRFSDPIIRAEYPRVAREGPR